MSQIALLFNCNHIRMFSRWIPSDRLYLKIHSLMILPDGVKLHNTTFVTSLTNSERQGTEMLPTKNICGQRGSRQSGWIQEFSLYLTLWDLFFFCPQCPHHPGINAWMQKNQSIILGTGISEYELFGADPSGFKCGLIKGLLGRGGGLRSTDCI